MGISSGAWIPPISGLYARGVFHRPSKRLSNPKILQTNPVTTRASRFGTIRNLQPNAWKAAVEDGQGVFDFAGKDSLIISNLGVGRRVFNQLPQRKREELCCVEKLIAAHHGKGRDELTHRRLKDFGFQALPFKSFAANTVLYYVMVIGFNVMEFFKRDVLGDQVTKLSYPTTVRRRFLDFAAKIVRSGRKAVMKVTASTMERLDLRKLWARCQEPDPLFS